MTNPETLSRYFQRTHWLIKRQTEGLSHADSLLQLPFRGNCLNWVVGHLAVYRDTILALLDQPPELGEAELALYGQGSEPITSGERAVPLPRLLGAIDASQDKLLAALAQVTPQALALVVDEERGRTVGERLDFFQWHETYHVGQLEILRQLAGTDDKII